jgi:hypothetical protein
LKRRRDIRRVISLHPKSNIILEMGFVLACKIKNTKAPDMKNLLNQTDRQEITSRINALTSDHKAQWGVMDVGQMLAHCQKPLELALRERKPPRTLMGRIIGPMAIKEVFGPRPFKKNGYTPPPFKVTGPEDFKTNKDKLLALVERFPQEMPKVGLVHPFFGAMPLEQWGEGAYKHLDYHLGQFGA